MVVIVILVVIAVAAITAFVYARRSEFANRRIAGYIGWGLLACGLLFGGFNSFYTQDPGEAVVVRSFTGEVVGSTVESGLHLTAPWNSTESFDIRNQKLEMYTNAGGEGADGSALSVPLSGGANATVSITVIYSIQPDQVENIYANFKTQEGLRDNALKAKLRDVVRNATATYAPLEVKENRAQLGNDILAALTAAWTTYGVTIDQVNLGDISLDESTEKAISGVITAQQEVEQARAGLEKSQILAEVTKTEAQAEADADQIIRCGASISYDTRIINGVETKVTVVTPNSNENCEDRLNEQVLLTKYFETLKAIGESGNMVVIVPEGGATPIITLPSGDNGVVPSAPPTVVEPPA